MKFKRFVSFVLSFLLLAVSFPLNSMVMNLSAGATDDQAKIEAIKTAWTAMEEKVLEIVPGTGKSTSVTAQYVASSNSGLLPTGVQEVPETVGSVYVKTSVSKSSNAATVHTLGSDYLKYGKSDDNIQDMNVYMSFYIETLNGSLSFVPFFREASATGDDTGKLYTVTPGDVGHWVTLESDELKGGSFHETDNLKNNIILCVNSSAANVIYFGSFLFTRNVSLPENSEGWTLEQWKDAGNALDLSKYMNTQVLSTALEVVDPEGTALKKLKTAWGNMQEKVLELAPASKGTAVTDFSVAAASDIDALTGGFYTTFTSGAYTGNEAAALGSGGNYIKYRESTMDVSQCNVYLSFYVEKFTGNLSFISYFRFNGSGGGNTGREYTVTQNDVGHWVTVETQNLTSSTYSEVVKNLNNAVILGVNSSNPVALKFGSYLFTKSVKLPQNTENWTYSNWVNAALSLDVSSYINTEPFLAALDAACNGNEELSLARKLKTAWSGMTKKIAEVNYNGANGISETNWYYPVSNTEGLPEAAAAGIAKTNAMGYASATFFNTGVFSETSYGTSYLRSGTTITALAGSDVFLSFFVEKSQYQEGLSFYISYRASGAGYYTGKLYTIQPEDVGHWVTLSGSDLTASGTVSAAHLGNSAVLSVYGAKETGSKIIFTTLYFTNKVSIPEDSGLWDLPELTARAKALNLTELLGTEDFLTAIREAEAYLKEHGIPLSKVEAIPDDFDQFGENLFTDLTPQIRYHNGKGVSELNTEQAEYIVDGDLSTATALEGVTVGEGKYLDITYALNGYVAVEKLLTAGLPSSKTGAFEIYLASNADSLYDSQNCFITADSGISFESGSLLTLYVPQMASYIGFRFKECSGTLQVAELGVFGTKTDYLIETGNFSNDKLKSLGYNLISYKDPKLRLNGNKFNNAGYASSLLYDNNPSTGYGVPNATWNDGEDESKYCDIYYDLGDSYKISRFEFNHWNESFLETGIYEIYVSGSMGELFLQASQVLQYDNRSISENGTTVSQLFTFAEGCEPVGRYVCFRIRCSVSNWEMASKRYPGLLYIRITELGVYGEAYTPPASPINLLSHVPVDIYRSSGNKHTLIGTNELDSDQVKMLYDGVYDAAVPIETRGKTLDFVFNLCGSMKLDELNIFAAVAEITRLKIYAAETAEETWATSALVYDSGTLAAAEIKKVLDSQVAARFLRYSITVSSSVFHAVEFEAIGMDDQALTYRNLLLENDSAVSVYTMTYATGYLRRVQEYENKTYARPYMRKSYMTDGDASTVYDIYSAKYGKSSIDIIVDLGALHSVDSIVLRAGSDQNHWPENMKIYVSESEAKVIDSAANPVYTFSEKTEDGVYAYESSPQYARYIRFQITKSVHPYTNTYMLAVISELEIGGLAVSGQVAEDIGAVLSFTDATSNIKVNIMQRDDNDVYAGVNGIKVSTVDPTLSEKRSLESYSMMIYGKKYLIELLDREGNRVTDVGGRNITVFLPVPEGLSPDRTYAVFFSGGAAKVLETNVYENRIATVLDDPTNIALAAVAFVVKYPDDYFAEEIEEGTAGDPVIRVIDTTSTVTVSNELTLKDEATGIKVVYIKGTFPENVKLTVIRKGIEVLPNLLAKQFDERDFAAYEIQFTSDGKEAIPNGTVRIIFPVPNGMNGEICRVYAVSAEKNALTDMSAILTEEGISFVATEGGVYMVTDADFDSTGTKIIEKNNKHITGGLNSEWVIRLLAAGILLAAVSVFFIILFAKRRRKTENKKGNV